MTVYDDIAGTNYLPSEATHQHNFYGLLSSHRGTYDAAVVGAELASLASHGCSELRVFTTCLAWWANRAEFIANLDDLATQADANGMKILLVIFDAVIAGNIGGDPTRNPVWDYIRNGAANWDPEAATNPGLVNAIGAGLLDEVAKDDDANLDGLVPYTGVLTGGWMGSPDPLYMVMYDWPAYPTLPSESFNATLWTELGQYVDDCIQTIWDATGTPGDALRGIELCNEPGITYAFDNGIYTVPWRRSTGGGFTFPNAAFLQPQIPDYTADPSGAFALARSRCYAFVRWWKAYVEDVHAAKSVATTIGHTSAGELFFWVSPALFAVPEDPIIPTFFSYHDYSPGYVSPPGVGGLGDTAALVRASINLAHPGKGLVVSEFFRLGQGPEWSLTHSVKALSDLGVGGYGWGIGFETNQFGLPLPVGANLAPSPAPSFDFFPETGLARSYMDPGHVIVDRWAGASGLFGLRDWIDAWFAGAAVPATKRYLVEHVSGLDFRIVDEVGVPPTLAADTRVVWRWRITRTLGLPYHYLPCALGAFSLNIQSGAIGGADQQTGISAGAYTCPATPGPAFSNCRLVLQAWLIDGADWSLDEFENLRVIDAGQLSMPAEDVWPGLVARTGGILGLG